MEFYFSNTYVIPVILASVLLAFLLSYFQYKNEKDDILSVQKKRFLASIRFVAFFIIAFLLTDAAIKRIKNKRLKPEIIVAVDNSKSMQPFQDQSLGVINQLQEELKNTNIHFWEYGQQASGSTNFDFESTNSNYSNLFEELTKSYLNSNIGAVLMVGDGIFNKGKDPVFQSRLFPFPVYTIGIGDTVQHRDAVIKHVNLNKKAYLNNYFPVEIGIDFTLAAGKQLKLEIHKSKEIVYSQNINVRSDHFFYMDLIHLKADEAGINNYTLTVSGLENEPNQDNNKYDFSILIISEKQKILVMGNSPHPDLSALHNSLKLNQNYSVDIQTGISSKKSFEEYDLVILHQLPNANRESNSIINKLMSARIPTLFIIGSQTSIPLFNLIQKSAVIPNTNLFENAGVIINEQFSLFQTAPQLSKSISNYPPLQTPFADIKLATGIETLFFQSIKNTETTNPLIALGSKNNKRTGFIFGEGIWRWRIYEFLKNGTHKQFDKLIQQITNYLIIKPDEDNFNIYHPDIFDESESVSMQAELFNASNEMINDPEVNIVITSDDSTSYSFIFDTYGSKYQLNAGKLPVGNYNYTASTVIGEKKYKNTGAFRISPLQNETIDNKADFQTLKQISSNTGGEFYQSNEIQKLLTELNEAEILKRKKIGRSVFQEILDLKWLFILVVFLFSVEWFLRRLWGTY